MTVDPSQPLGNLILDALPQTEYERLRSHLNPVQLQQGDVLIGLRQPISQVYFPTTAVVFWLNSTLEGDTVAIGLTGFEGMVGTLLLLNQSISPWQVEVQITGAAWAVSSDTFLNVLQASEILQQQVQDWAYQELLQLAQSTVCQRFHPLEQRLCRWLLATQERVAAPELRLTREILAKMLGATRPAVTRAIGTLSSAGLIDPGPGRITLLNQEEIEESACACYWQLKQARDRP